MTEEELARHDSKTLLQLLLSADARCDALTAQLESTLKDRAAIIAERDRTFALMLARAEKAEAERDRLGREVNVAKYGQPDFAWSIHKAAMVDLQTDNTRLREALEVCVASIEHADMSEGVCCCGEEIEGHSDPMHSGHMPVDMGEYHAFLVIKEARAALKGESHD